MAKLDFTKGFKGKLQDAVGTVKAAAKDVKIPDVSIEDIRAGVAVAKTKAAEMWDSVKTNALPDEAEVDEAEVLDIRTISTRSAMKVIFYMMAADGEIYHSEEEKFDEIGKELDPDYARNKAGIIKECQTQLDKVMEPDDYFDVLRDGIEDALLASRQTADTFITPKMLLWDLLTVAYSDENYDEAERKLMKYVVRKTNIDKAVFVEMESTMLTLMDIERELAWIKTTNRPYLVIEAMVNELADRKNVIFESVKDLVML